MTDYMWDPAWTHRILQSVNPQYYSPFSGYPYNPYASRPYASDFPSIPPTHSLQSPPEENPFMSQAWGAQTLPSFSRASEVGGYYSHRCHGVVFNHVVYTHGNQVTIYLNPTRDHRYEDEMRAERERRLQEEYAKMLRYESPFLRYGTNTNDFLRGLNLS